jgi:hypothetical protein
MIQLTISPSAQASFEREFEEYNRQRFSLDVVDQLTGEVDNLFEVDEAPLSDEPLTDEQKEELLLEEGQWVLRRPNAGLNFNRNSNFFSERTDPRSEVIWDYDFALGLSKKLGIFRYDTQHQVSYSDYVIHDANSTFTNEWSQSLVAEGTYFSVDFSSDVLFDAFPGEDEKKTNKRTSAMSAAFAYHPSPSFNFIIDYSRNENKFLADTRKESDSYSNTYNVNSSYQLFPHTRINGGATFRFNKRPKLSSDSDIDVFTRSVGLAGRLFTKMGYSALIAVEDKNSNDPNTQDSTATTFIGQLQYRMTSKTNTTLSYQRAIVPEANESIGSDGLNHFVALNFSLKPTSKIAVSLSEGVRYILSPTISSAQDPDEPAITTTKQKETIFLTTKLSINYTISRVTSFNVVYTHQRIDSDLKLNDRKKQVWNVGFSRKF